MCKSGTVLRLLALFTLLVTVVFSGLGLRSTSVVRATSSPCDAVQGDPNPPSGPELPAIGGTILSSSAGVSGATVRLYRCDSLNATLVATQTTGSGGTFSFSSLTGPKWYYIAVDESGPLAGKTPASGTNNPTDAIEVGAGDTGLSLNFE